MSEHTTQLTHTLPGDLAAAVRAALDDRRQNKKVARLWARDASLWTGADEARWLGWLELTRTTETECRKLTVFEEEIRSEGFTRALVLGIGGSKHSLSHPRMASFVLRRRKVTPEIHARQC